jgi:polysaccharide pyruvyl transferase WcaK-like protein
MIIELRGVNFNNKGAELMLHAVVQQVSSWNSDNIVALRPTPNTSFRQRAEAGVYQLAWINQPQKFSGVLPDMLAHLIPMPYRRMYGVITYSEVQAILDASGFAFTDQWGSSRSERLAKECQKWKRQGKKIILLPQAFGPFDSTPVKKAFSQVVEKVDLIFARDRQSYEYLMTLGSRTSHIQIAPDFTNLVKGLVPEYFTPNINKVCIVPNCRMIDKTSEDVQNKYLLFLKICAEYFLQMNKEPFLLIHQTGDGYTHSDYGIALQLQQKLGKPINIIRELNPLFIKGILGSCFAVVGSRFHSLVSAMSQGVPCLGTGWSHKYKTLFEEYGCPECLISPLKSEEEIHEKLTLITDEPHRSSCINKLAKNSSEQKEMTLRMWTEVREIIGS